MNLKPLAVVVFALALPSLAARDSDAQVATDVVCDLCVNNSDLSNNSVTSGRIVDGTIKSNDIAAGGVATANIANRAVSFGKLSTGVRDALDGALAHLTKTAVEDSAVGLAEAACPSSRVAISASCLCDDNNGANNFGVLFACLVDGNGALAACFDEAATFNPTKDPPIAIVQAVCLGAESTDGTPWDPTPAGLAPLSGSSGSADAQAAWHKAQHDALQARAAELRAKRDAHRARLLD
ncbi:MAG TPA: hypothetical protein VJL86_13900 [Steroidobacteraceae bacterium]|nr:hypothetical protein [Steroidobacteraceae bacterium]